MISRARFTLICVLAPWLGAASFAEAPSGSTLKEIFERAAKDIAARTSVPIYVPVSLQSLDPYVKGFW